MEGNHLEQMQQDLQKSSVNAGEVEEGKVMGASSSQISLTQSACSDEGPILSDLAKCYVMNKSHQLKSRLIYISDMTLYVTYVSDDGEQLVVALSVEL